MLLCREKGEQQMTRPVESDVSCVCLVLWATLIRYPPSSPLCGLRTQTRVSLSLVFPLFSCEPPSSRRRCFDLSCLALSRCQRRDLLRPRILRGFRCRSGRILLLLQSLTNFVGTSPGPEPLCLWARALMVFGHEPFCFVGPSPYLRGHEPLCWWARALMLVGTSPYVVYC